MKSLIIIIVLLSVIHLPVFKFHSVGNGINADRKAIYWNVPSFQCMDYGLDFTKLLDKYNIIHNINGSFDGDMITILYDPGNFPDIIINATGEYLRNGGVPQAGDLSDHLQRFEKSVIAHIPDEGNAGLSIIDHELWKPVYRQNSGDYRKYQTLSQDLVRKEHPNWSDEKIIEEAKKRFNENASKFMVETLKSAKKLRPKVLWGFYHFPYCFTNGTQLQCDQQVRDENDGLLDIYQLNDNLYPSVYIKQNNCTIEEHVRFIETSLDEATRIRDECDGNKKIYVYFWYKYGDTRNFLKLEDLAKSLAAIVKYDIDGIVMWGAHADVDSAPVCKEVYDYIDNTFGPIRTSIV